MLDDWISGERIAAACDHQWEPGRDCPPSGIVYCKRDYVHDLLPMLGASCGRYVLVTHNSDLPIADADAARLPGNVAAWFGPNVATDNGRVHPIPLGLANSRWPHGDIGVWRRALGIPRTQVNLLYVNFNPATNPKAREPLLAMFRPMPWATVERDVPLEHYAAQLRRHPFVLCPPGNGFDTHRTYEALHLGACPLVLDDGHLWPDVLPLLRVRSWAEVTEGLLLGHRAREPEGLIVAYWRCRFERALA